MICSIDTLNLTTVVFSRNYLPLCRIPIRRAIVLLITGKAEPLDLCSQTIWEIRSPNLILHVPDQIRLTITSGERWWKVPAVNRREVLRRDRHQCQYCGSRHQLTLDHVIPRSKGGKHTWDNVVTACQSCNAHKSDRTPQQAGMILLTQPQAPIHPAIAFAEQFWQSQSVNGV